MHIIPILWMLTWPVIIVVSYYAVVWMVKKYESKFESKLENEDDKDRIF